MSREVAFLGGEKLGFRELRESWMGRSHFFRGGKFWEGRVALGMRKVALGEEKRLYGDKSCFLGTKGTLLGEISGFF